jgi:asparagine synthase (glutamine-hydrolysing)
MCGICGILNLDGRPPDRAVLADMNSALTHRGPDDEGYYVSGPAGLAMRRLSIIDLATGRQPISNESGDLHIVYNGELYNFRELRNGLIARGHRFLTSSDTEVVLHLYEEEGPRCLQKMNGMFAFCIWNSRTHELILARDRIGIKPLFYYLDRERLVFGSEIKSILRHPAVPASLNLQALYDYLSLNYMPVPSTALKDVQQVPPGHYLAVENGRTSLHQYWELHFREEPGSEDDHAARLGEALKASVKRRLVSDVPFGAFLSGGVDSSIVVGLMSEIMNEPVKTFSIGFEEKSFSELPNAREVASLFKTDHHELTVKPDMAGLLPKIVWHSDEPSADSSAIPVYYVSQLARKHVTMVLTGDGGDEVFAGYDTYIAQDVMRLYRMLPSLLRRRIVAPLVHSLPVSMTKVSLDFKAKRFVSGAELDPLEAHYSWRQIFSEDDKLELFRPEALDAFEPQCTYRHYEEKFGAVPGAALLNKMLFVDTRFYLPGDMLVKVDRMSMANSLEARVPMLDHELVELAATIPAGLKLKRWDKKHMLKRAGSRVVPMRILRRKKQGFNVPVNVWLAGELRELAMETLSERKVSDMGLFRPSYVRALMDDHMSKRKDNSFQLWGLVTFFIWYDLFVKRRGAPAPAGAQAPA